MAVFAIAALAITTAVMTSYASGPNHLIELATLAAICAALWAEPHLARRSWLARAALAIAVIGATWRDLVPAARYAEAPRSVRSRLIAVVRAEPREVLTEDPLIALAAGRQPVVTDMDALRALAVTGDTRALRIVSDLARGRFGLVVLNDDIEASRSWYEAIGFRDLTIPPIERRYAPAGALDDFHLYRARP